MAIDNLPAVQSILEQQNLLERLFQEPLDARLAYSRLADDEIFPNGIGETITKSRPALFPLTAATTPINPSANTGLDNGLTDTYAPFEQYQLAINEYALTTTVNIMQDRTIIQRMFLENVRLLGENAGRTMDQLCAQQIHKAYDAGNTFTDAGASNVATSVHVDNIVGFDTVFAATNSPGLPSAVSSSNPCIANVYNGSTGAFEGSLQVQAVVPDGTNASSANVGGVAYGISGNLTLKVATGFTINAGDTIVAADGAYVVRPNGKMNRGKLTASDTLTLATLAQAVAKLRARNVPTLPNGNYACIIDPTLWPQLLSDSAFNYATMGQMGEGGSYFTNGMVNRTLGLEFVNSNLVPSFWTAYGTGNQPTLVKARHALVGGMGLLVRGTFNGHIEASRQASALNNSDIRFIDAARVAMITRAPLDRLQEFIMQSWKWVGGFVAPTDVTSTQAVIPTTDAARYKRCVVVECGSTV